MNARPSPRRHRLSAMGAAKDPVWAYFTATDDPRRFVCKFCTKTLFGNPTVLKKHVVSEVCSPPADVYRILRCNYST